MSTEGIIASVATATKPTSERRKPYLSGLMLRLLIAFVISWLIVLAFFVTSVASR